MSNLKILHNQLETSLVAMIKNIAKTLVSPKVIYTNKLAESQHHVC